MTVASSDDAAESLWESVEQEIYFRFDRGERVLLLLQVRHDRRQLRRRRRESVGWVEGEKVLNETNTSDSMGVP